MICAVYMVDISPTGGYLATLSKDLRVRVCKSLPIRPFSHLPSTHPSYPSFFDFIQVTNCRFGRTGCYSTV